jgi:hypothetical protein
MHHCEHGLSVPQDGMEVLPFRQQHVRLVAGSKGEAVKSCRIYVNTVFRIVFSDCWLELYLYKYCTPPKAHLSPHPGLAAAAAAL